MTDLSATTDDFVVVKVLPVANAAAATVAAVVPVAIALDVAIAVSGTAAVVEASSDGAAVFTLDVVLASFLGTRETQAFPTAAPHTQRTRAARAGTQCPREKAFQPSIGGISAVPACEVRAAKYAEVEPA